jgi:predicted DCC family thiol-disulfide oxidoreductase YuxK
VLRKLIAELQAFSQCIQEWTWLFHFIPRVIRDEIYDLVARNRYRWFGRRDTCILPNSDRSW